MSCNISILQDIMSTDKVLGNYSSLEDVDIKNIQNLSIDKLELLKNKYIDEIKNNYNKFTQKKNLIKDIKNYKSYGEILIITLL